MRCNRLSSPTLGEPARGAQARPCAYSSGARVALCRQWLLQGPGGRLGQAQPPSPSAPQQAQSRPSTAVPQPRWPQQEPVGNLSSQVCLVAHIPGQVEENHTWKKTLAQYPCGDGCSLQQHQEQSSPGAWAPGPHVVCINSCFHQKPGQQLGNE